MFQAASWQRHLALTALWCLHPFSTKLTSTPLPQPAPLSPALGLNLQSHTPLSEVARLELEPETKQARSDPPSRTRLVHLVDLQFERSLVRLVELTKTRLLLLLVLHLKITQQDFRIMAKVVDLAVVQNQMVMVVVVVKLYRLHFTHSLLLLPLTTPPTLWLLSLPLPSLSLLLTPPSLLL